MPITIAVTASALYISLVALLALYLAYRVVQFRLTKKVDLGDDGSPEFIAVIRAHANLIEWAPITLMLLLVSELLGSHVYFVHAMGATFFVSRLAHAYGLTVSNGGNHKGRFFGTLGNWIVLVVLSINNILFAVGVL